MKFHSRSFLLFVLFTMNIFLVQAQSYNQLWKNVKQADEKDLPKTGLKWANTIYKKAQSENNFPQEFRAFLTIKQYRQDLSPDSFYVDLSRLENWADNESNPVGRAVLHTWTAIEFANVALENGWMLAQRKDIIDQQASNDIRTWTTQQFRTAIFRHAHAALKEKEALLKASVKDYAAFTNMGEDSKYFNHDLYHVVCYQLLDAIYPTLLDDSEEYKKENNTFRNSVYEEMLATYRQAGLRDAQLLVSLQQLDEKKSEADDFAMPRENDSQDDEPIDSLALTRTAYWQSLEKLRMQFADCETLPEVCIREAQSLQDNNLNGFCMRLCMETIDRFPHYERICELQRIVNVLKEPSLHFSLTNKTYPGRKVGFTVTHCNLSGFKLVLMKRGKIVGEQHFDLIKPSDYTAKDTMLYLSFSDVGEYVVKMIPDQVILKQKDRENLQTVTVTRFNLQCLALPNDKSRLTVVDDDSGKPLEGVSLEMLGENKNKIGTLTTDKKGECVADLSKKPLKNGFEWIKLTKEDDVYMSAMTYSDYYFSTDDKRESVNLLTDRALYRPGQPVYVKGVAYHGNQKEVNVSAHKSYKLSLIDSRMKTIAEKKVTTNEFGSFNETFTLPSSCLNGDFRIHCDNDACFFRVEEYKRPTFQIKLNKPEKSYAVGQQVEVKGNVSTLSGVPLSTGKLTYTVERGERFSWFFRKTPSSVIATDTATIDNNGNFSIPFRLAGKSGKVYLYSVHVTVKNSAGETQEEYLSLYAGKTSIVLEHPFSSRECNKEKLKANFKVSKLDGTNCQVQGDYQLKDSLHTIVRQGTFLSNKEMTFDEWKSLPSGAYKLIYSAKDSQGRLEKDSQDIALYSRMDMRPPVTTKEWISRENLQFSKEHPALLDYGTSYKNAYVWVDMFAGEKLLESKLLLLNDTIYRFNIPYKKEYGDGVLLATTFVKDGVCYHHENIIEYVLPDKKLQLKWKVFRDKLQPGQKECWSLSAYMPNGKPASAELIAKMSDASLDMLFKENAWPLVSYYLKLPRVDFSCLKPYGNCYFEYRENHRLDSPSCRDLLFDSFVVSTAIDGIEGTGQRFGKSLPVMALATRSVSENKSAQRSTLRLKGVNSESFMLGKQEQSSDAAPLEPSVPNVPLRQNFSETAFFYPQLRTDANGEVSFSFTVPESLTSWNFRAYAHTKDMFEGLLDAQAVTSKDFMLMPNMPRFVRTGDHASVAAVIANRTNRPLKGTAYLTLFDPMTEKAVLTRKQSFAADSSKTTSVTFDFDVPAGYELLGCKLIADGSKFSDGEQHLLPVLSDKVRVIESVPLPIRGNQTREFSLKSLFNNQSSTATDKRLTVEYTGNPAWYAVQTLPALANPSGENAISYATACYATTLASWIMNAQPKVKAVFDTWKLQENNGKETFLSNLQKNQDVKNILLSESPWLLDAQNEQEMQHRLSTLFDVNSVSMQQELYLNKLRELQLSDGSWPWYKGMNGSNFVTEYIALLNARLSRLTGKSLSGEAENMQERALNYIDTQVLKEYRQRKADKQELYGSYALDYLYLSAVSGHKIPEANRSMYDYFLSQCGKQAQGLSMREKAMSATVLGQAGRKDQAALQIASLREHLTSSDELGMYFDFNESPYNYYGWQVPAHVRVMEALDEVAHDSQTVDEMKIWLLKQKQTLMWNSPITTADAVYTLLYSGAKESGKSDNSLLSNSGDVRLSFGDNVLETLSPAKTTVPALGYVKGVYTDKSSVSAKEIKVEKRDAGIAWGAAYGECMENLSALKGNSVKALSVEKQLYVERPAEVGRKAEMTGVTKDTELHVGDVVVSRLIIRSDRAMDFVQLKDQRACCMEPVGNLSGYRWQSGLGYYIDIKDASVNYFFDGLGKGTFVLESRYRVDREGTYNAGMATLQCAYAPEFASHSGTQVVKVVK